MGQVATGRLSSGKHTRSMTFFWRRNCLPTRAGGKAGAAPAGYGWAMWVETLEYQLYLGYHRGIAMYTYIYISLSLSLSLSHGNSFL